MSLHPKAVVPAAERAGDAERVRVLGGLLVVAFAISVVHYTDNVVNIDNYPRTTSIPNPEGWFVALMWFPFTAAGLLGFLRFSRGGASATALLALAFYSGSGLIGSVHYLGAGAAEMPWWRHAHIVADVLSGVAIFAFSLREARQRARHSAGYERIAA